ncbi:BA14K family protein [Nitratireductor basaltis]|uniref:Lectin-like protein BA14k n=1 Tax=Nitratireductor basaltis TaxID=472175 RepID=A0A084U8I0_9HYPH|nr:BA14K family protein [Nitratireductor basaltis]KFB09266.1 BA14K-like protein precursor [Nitratireductor basaltis]
MKILMAIMGGFIASSTVFASGAALAIYMLATETVDPTKDMGPQSGVPWTVEPKVVKKNKSEGEREVASADEDQGRVSATLVASASASEGPEDIDAMQTASVSQDAREEQTGPNPQLVAKHVAWCDRKYRSYRRSTNSYTPYSGGQRECVSPFTDEIKAQSLNNRVVAAADTGANSVAQLSQAQPVQRSRSQAVDHIKSCFERYRSYRVADNTYQPYGGGPRRQCR